MAPFKKIKMKQQLSIIILVCVATYLQSCSIAPEPLKVGTDNCYFCKMTISDARFGAEILTKKGKVYKFDDVHCILSYLKTNDIPAENIQETYLTDFSGSHQLLNTKKILLLKSEALHSPMGGNVAAFDNADSLKKIQQKFTGETASWEALRAQ
jgi:copper chaperone NosL